MTTQRTAAAAAEWRPTLMTGFAIVVIAVGYPAFRMAVGYLDLYPADGRAAWWSLWGVILVGHWVAALVCAAAIASERGGWGSIGLDWRFFIRTRYIWALLAVAAMVAALWAPGYFYAGEAPAAMRSHPLGPVTAGERTFWIAMAVTAGSVEEILFRGYLLTRLSRFIGVPATFLISTLSFALMHGPSAFIPQFLALYLVSGALFAGLFIAFRMRRLEWLIVAHALIDLALVAAP